MHYLRGRRAQDRASELGLRFCPHCDGDMSTARRNSRYCSTQCQTAAWVAANTDLVRVRARLAGAKRKAAKYGNPGYSTFAIQDWLNLLETLANRCTYCGVQAGANDLQMDHIVPLKRGGPHRLSNITPACSACNQSKRDRPLLFGWAPRLLGGKPRWDRSAPRGQRSNQWNSSEWRDSQGPLQAVRDRASRTPELLRAIALTEHFFQGLDSREQVAWLGEWAYNRAHSTSESGSSDTSE
jgi:hypothetical protein